MRLKTFSAGSIAKAMAAVRAELGDDAIIVSTESGRNGRGIRVVVAIDEPDIDAAIFDQWEDEAETTDGGMVGSGAVGDAAAPPAASLLDIPGPVAGALAYHGVPVALAERLTQAAAAIHGAEPVPALAAALDGTLAFQPFADRLAQRPLMLVGPPGVGKTLTAARLVVDAHRRGRPVAALCCDTSRAGGFEQLDAFMRILGVPLAAVETPQAVAEAVRSALLPPTGTPARAAAPPAGSAAGAAAGTAVVIDSAGANPWDAHEMRALGRLIAAADAEPVLVLAAGADASESGEIAAAFARLGCRRMVATRLDVSRRLGGVLSAAATGRLALAGAGISPHAAEAPSLLTALSLARLLLTTTPRTIAARDPKETVR